MSEKLNICKTANPGGQNWAAKLELRLKSVCRFNKIHSQSRRRIAVDDLLLLAEVAKFFLCPWIRCDSFNSAPTNSEIQQMYVPVPVFLFAIDSMIVGPCRKWNRKTVRLPRPV